MPTGEMEREVWKRLSSAEPEGGYDIKPNLVFSLHGFYLGFGLYQRLFSHMLYLMECWMLIGCLPT